ncbi:MAG: hypothetical protein ABFQ65_01885 [Nanoarchaeota archaeon]
MSMVGAVESTCTIEWASWKSDTGDRIDITDTVKGDVVSLYVYGSKGCEGLEVSFEIFEDDLGLDDPVEKNPEDTIFVDGVAKGTWTAEYQFDGLGKPEYYFRVKVPEILTTVASIHGLNAIFDKGEELVVSLEGDCNFISAYWNTTSVKDGDEVKLIVKSVHCDEKEVLFDIFEDDELGAGGGEKINNSIKSVFNDNEATAIWKSEWQDDYKEFEGRAEYPDGTEVTTLEFELNPPEYYFIATLADDESETIRSLGGISRSKITDGENKYEIHRCNDEFCELVVVKSGICTGNLKSFSCSDYQGSTYCLNTGVCKWDDRGYCYGNLTCSTFNDNHESCLNYQECIWIPS